MAHTPGPWLVAERPWVVVSASGSKLHVVADCIGSMKMKKAEAEANALLIAAAPELLEALIDAQLTMDYAAVYLTYEDGSLGAIQLAETRKSIIDAIARATGDTPQ